MRIEPWTSTLLQVIAVQGPTTGISISELDTWRIAYNAGESYPPIQHDQLDERNGVDKEHSLSMQDLWKAIVNFEDLGYFIDHPDHPSFHTFTLITTLPKDFNILKNFYPIDNLKIYMKQWIWFHRMLGIDLMPIIGECSSRLIVSGNLQTRSGLVWNMPTLHLYEAILQSKSEGLASSKCAERFKMDPRSVFHYCKRLESVGLVQKITTFTYQPILKATLFSSPNDISTKRVVSKQTVVEEKLVEIKCFVLKQLLESSIMVIDDLKNAFKVAYLSDNAKPQFVHPIEPWETPMSVQAFISACQSLIKEKLIEKIKANSQRKDSMDYESVFCYKLISEDLSLYKKLIFKEESVETKTTRFPFLLPFEPYCSQLFHYIQQQRDGAVVSELSDIFPLRKKYLESILSDLADKKLNRILENFGKERRHRYIFTFSNEMARDKISSNDKKNDILSTAYKSKDVPASRLSELQLFLQDELLKKCTSVLEIHKPLIQLLGSLYYGQKSQEFNLDKKSVERAAAHLSLNHQAYFVILANRRYLISKKIPEAKIGEAIEAYKSEMNRVNESVIEEHDVIVERIVQQVPIPKIVMKNEHVEYLRPLRSRFARLYQFHLVLFQNGSLESFLYRLTPIVFISLFGIAKPDISVDLNMDPKSFLTIYDINQWLQSSLSKDIIDKRLYSLKRKMNWFLLDLEQLGLLEHGIPSLFTHFKNQRYNLESEKDIIYFWKSLAFQAQPLPFARQWSFEHSSLDSMVDCQYYWKLTEKSTTFYYELLRENLGHINDIQSFLLAYEKSENLPFYGHHLLGLTAPIALNDVFAYATSQEWLLCWSILFSRYSEYSVVFELLAHVPLQVKNLTNTIFKGLLILYQLFFPCTIYDFISNQQEFWNQYKSHFTSVPRSYKPYIDCSFSSFSQRQSYIVGDFCSFENGDWDSILDDFKKDEDLVHDLILIKRSTFMTIPSLRNAQQAITFAKSIGLIPKTKKLTALKDMVCEQFQLVFTKVNRQSIHSNSIDTNFIWTDSVEFETLVKHVIRNDITYEFSICSKNGHKSHLDTTLNLNSIKNQKQISIPTFDDCFWTQNQTDAVVDFFLTMIDRYPGLPKAQLYQRICLWFSPIELDMLLKSLTDRIIIRHQCIFSA